MANDPDFAFWRIYFWRQVPGSHKLKMHDDSPIRLSFLPCSIQLEGNEKPRIVTLSFKISCKSLPASSSSSISDDSIVQDNSTFGSAITSQINLLCLYLTPHKLRESDPDFMFNCFEKIITMR